MNNTTITISKKLARQLWTWKKNLDARSIEDVIDRILKIVPASELKQLDKQIKEVRE